MSLILDDEKVWFPKDQTLLKTNPANAPRRLGEADSEDDHIVFALGSQDMGALNRCLHGGRVLPLDRTSYFRSVGIIDTKLLTQNILTEVDQVIEAYKILHDLCTGFLEDQDTKAQNAGKAPKDDDSGFDKLSTWSKMNELASAIYGYSENAGSKSADGSFYGDMLKWCGDYNKSKSQDEKNTIRQNIQDICNALLQGVDNIKSRVGKVKIALQEFDARCQGVASTLQGLEEGMVTILNAELGDIELLNTKIAGQLKEISDDQAKIDADRFDQATVAAYVWIPLAGWVAGPVVFAQRQKDINMYQAKIDKLNDLIASENTAIAVNTKLQANVTSMKIQAENLSALMEPALKTIQKLEGGWGFMGTELEYLHKSVSQFDEQIPPLMLTTIQLDKIAQEWLRLNKYVASYIQSANLRPSVTVTSLEDYSQQLEDAKRGLQS